MAYNGFFLPVSRTFPLFPKFFFWQLQVGLVKFLYATTDYQDIAYSKQIVWLILALVPVYQLNDKLGPKSIKNPFASESAETWLYQNGKCDLKY